MAVDTATAGDPGPSPAGDPRQVWRPSASGAIARLAALAAIVLAVLWITHSIPVTLTNRVSTAFVFAIVALSMNVLVGYAGQVSFGHAAFVGVGAFGSAIAISDSGLPYPAALLVALLTGAISALILGGIALRVRGLYLAIVTIAYGLLGERVIFNIRQLTGGGAGKFAPRPEFLNNDSVFLGMDWSGDEKFAVFCLVALVVVWLFDWRLTSSKAGRAIQALRDDERVAASWGINVTGYKLLAFVISGSIAGLAGALFAGVEQIAVPTSFSFTLSLTFVLMTVVGGLGSRPGVVAGGILFAVLGTLLDQAHQHLSWWPGFITAQWEPLIGATLLLLTLTSFPGGLAEQFGPVFRWLSFKPFREAKAVTVGGGTGGGGMGARP